MKMEETTGTISIDGEELKYDVLGVEDGWVCVSTEKGVFAGNFEPVGIMSDELFMKMLNRGWLTMEEISTDYPKWIERFFDEATDFSRDDLDVYLTNAYALKNVLEGAEEKMDSKLFVDLMDDVSSKIAAMEEVYLKWAKDS